MSSKQHVTLMVAYKIGVLKNRGLTQQEIADDLNIGRRTIQRVYAGDLSLKTQRTQADRMEAFLGGVIVGSGNTRFHASAPADAENQRDSSMYAGSKVAHHALGTHYENDNVVPPVSSTLDTVLAEEELVACIVGAGLDPEMLLELDWLSDLEEGSPCDVNNAQRRDYRADTWAEFVSDAKSRGVIPGDWQADDLRIPAYLNKTLMNEGQDVDVWSVRDVDFEGWPSRPWHTTTTNRIT